MAANRTSPSTISPIVAACGDVVGADVQHDVGRPRQLGHLAAEPRQRRLAAHLPAVGEQLVAGDAGVEHRHRRRAAAPGQAVGQRVGPAGVGVEPAADAISDRVAHRHQGVDRARCQDVDAGQHQPRADRRGERRALAVEREVAGPGEIGGLQRDRMLGDDVRRARQHQAHRDGAAGLGDDPDGVADQLAARIDDDGTPAPEGDRLDGPGHERRTCARAGGRDRPDGERGGAEPVGQPEAHLGTGGLRADDHAQGAPGERLVRRHGLRTGLPGRHPTGPAAVGRRGREVRQGRGSRPGAAGDRQAPEHRREQNPAQTTDRPPRRPSPTRYLRPTGIPPLATRTGGTPPAARPPRAAQRAGSPEREWAERVSPFGRADRRMRHRRRGAQ